VIVAEEYNPAVAVTTADDAMPTDVVTAEEDKPADVATADETIPAAAVIECSHTGRQ